MGVVVLAGPHPHQIQAGGACRIVVRERLYFAWANLLDRADHRRNLAHGL